MQLRCPRCTSRLERHGDRRFGPHWHCESCSGRAVVVPAVRRAARGPVFRQLWGEGVERADGLPCPGCTHPMRRAAVATAERSIDVDTCRRCQLVWLDAGESDAVMKEPLPAATPSEGAAPLSPQVAEMMKADLTRSVEQQNREVNPGPMKTVLVALGVPVEMETGRLLIRPWVTWILGASILAVWLLSLSRLDAVIADFGFVPDETGRMGGLTLLTAFFVHASWLHVLVNVYFLVVFGDDVEAALGRPWFLVLVFSGAVVGKLAHGLFSTRPDIPCVGASSGISALLVFYALTFRHHTVGVVVRAGDSFAGRYLNLTALRAFVVWLLLQLWLLAKQVAAVSSVSALGHLGGVLAGAVGWWIWSRTVEA